MIPFNYLGWAFKLFGKGVYPKWVLWILEEIVKDFHEKDIVLDIGSGTGIIINQMYMVNHKPVYIALDPAYGMLKYVPDYAYKVISKAENLPFKSEKFSLVTLGETLHHINDLQKALKEINRVLKKEGFLFIFDFDPMERKGKYIYTLEKIFNEPVNFFSPIRLKNFLEKFGFKSEYIKKDYRYVLIGKKYT